MVKKEDEEQITDAILSGPQEARQRMLQRRVAFATEALLNALPKQKKEAQRNLNAAIWELEHAVGLPLSLPRKKRRIGSD